MAGGCESPSIVVCATWESCRRIAASSSGWRWPCTLHHSEDTPSRYARPSVSKRVHPSARSTISGSGSSVQPCCCVNGCQRTLRSSAASSWVSMDPEARPPRGRIQLVAAVVGAASLGAEIAAARLLAPYFGASTIVWANTIATVLVALSAGYWVGGRLADRDPTLRGLCRLVLGAAGPPGRRALRRRAVPARGGRRAGHDRGRRLRRLAARRARARRRAGAPARRRRALRGAPERGDRRGGGPRDRPSVCDLHAGLAGRRLP